MKEEYFENLRRVLLESEVILGCSSKSIMPIIFLQTSCHQLSIYHITLWMQWESKSLPGLALTYFLASSLLLHTHTHTHTHTPLNSALSPHQVQNLVDPQQILLIQLERRVFPAGIFTSSESLSSLNLFVKLKQMRVTYKLILRSPQSYRNNLMLWRTPAY